MTTQRYLCYLSADGVVQCENDEQLAARRGPEVTGDMLALFAINTGALYETHKQLGRLDRSPLWHVHVASVVLPLYCSKVERARCSISERIRAATDLRNYYVAHVRELERSDVDTLGDISREAQEGGTP